VGPGPRCAGGLPGILWPPALAEVAANAKLWPQRPSACAHGDLGQPPGSPRDSAGLIAFLPAGWREGTFYLVDDPEQLGDT